MTKAKRRAAAKKAAARSAAARKGWATRRFRKACDELVVTADDLAWGREEARKLGLTPADPWTRFSRFVRRILGMR